MHCISLKIKLLAKFGPQQFLISLEIVALVSYIRPVSAVAIPVGLKARVHYALANVFNSNLSLTLEIKVMNVEDLDENWLANAPCNMHMCAKIGTLRYSRLFIVHKSTTYHFICQVDL